MSKVLIIHHSPLLGGAGISLIDMIEMLKSSFDVTVIIPHSKGDLYARLIKMNVNIIPFGNDIGMISYYNGGPKLFTMTFLRNFMNIIDNYGKMRRLIGYINPDLIVLNSSTIAWISNIRHSRHKWICYVREVIRPRLLGNLIRSYISNHFDRIYFISKFDLVTFKKPKTGLVMYDSLLIADRKLTEVPKHESLTEQFNFVVLYLGGSDAVKGWNLVKQLIPKLKEFNWLLIVAGYFNEDKIEAKNVKYTGFTNSVHEYIQLCDVVIFPSNVPHQARPVFEAGYHHKPIVITDFPETTEFVMDGYNGLVFTQSRVDELYHCLVQLYHKIETRMILGENNYEMYKKNHDFFTNKEKMINDMIKIMED